MNVPVYLLALVACVAGVSWSGGRHVLEQIRKKAELAYHARKQVAWTQCSDQPQSSGGLFHTILESASQSFALESNRQRRTTVRSKDTAIFLQRSQGQWTNEQSLSDHVFTVSLWCRPEGGQPSPAVILESEDLCLPFSNRGWSVGLHSPETAGEKDLRFYFRLHSWSKLTATTLTSPYSLPSRQWIHVAITFDGQTMLLYLNGAQAATSKSQATAPPSGPACRTLRIGGNTNHHYHGVVDDLRIWNSALDQEALRMVQHKKWPGISPRLTDDFIKLDNWDWAVSSADSDYGFKMPLLLSSDVPVISQQPIQPKINACGYTICDSPEVMATYKEHKMFRNLKVLRYRVIVLTENDGSNPTVTPEQIQNQHEFLIQAFEKYNITWELDELFVKDSNLRRRSVLLSCYASMVGNGVCEPECRHPSTGHDGGDCDDSHQAASAFRQNYLRVDDVDSSDSECVLESIGNSICDSECNVAIHKWDGGDCCLDSNSENCYEPSSPNRSYLDTRELKTILQLKNTRHINILFAHWTNRDIIGVATFPWEKNVFNELGGIVLQPSSYGLPGQMAALVHELGHSLGLWHVHRGVSEMDCSHPCFENEPTQFHGDLCSDTRPTPVNSRCQDPPKGHPAVCGLSDFTDTPYTNYMGYGDDGCVRDFSSEQTARMHCHIDLVYSSLTVKPKSLFEVAAPPPPLLLTAISKSSSSVTLSWLPSLATDAFYDTSGCMFCSNILEFSQYGYTAESNVGDALFNEMCSASEATGPPDSEPCVLSYKMWLPDAGGCLNDICTLTVYFKESTVPNLLQIWMTWNANRGLHEVELVFQDGDPEILRHLTAQCDAPITVPLFFNKTLTKIHIRTANRFVGIDAVKIVSVPNNPICAACKPIRYRISRDPPFDDGKSQEVDYPIFTDSGLHPKTVYTYMVQSWLANRVTAYSPTLTFAVSSPVCGDGIISVNEFCDDGNVSDNDGCSSSCIVEDSFHCTGEPSLCYWHEADGKCEEFEMNSSPMDCGFPTPKGFTDQWASSVQSGFEDSCPAEVVAGPPTMEFKCKRDQVLEGSWSPCTSEIDGMSWITAHFSKPVVATSVYLYITSDGIGNWPYQESSSSILKLLDANGASHHEINVEFTCARAPMEIPIVKDLRTAFHATAAINLTFYNSQIAISAIRLRSSDLLNPVEIGKCSRGEQYHPGLQKCDRYCQMEPCPQLVVKHAQMNCTGFNDGDTCIAVCNRGYHHMMNYSIFCQAGEWIGPDPYCKPVDCSMPLLAHADIICPDGTSFGKVCSYKCRPPARFIGGGSGLATIVCNADGQWSLAPVACQLNCLPPSPPKHTVLASSRCRKADSFQFGQTCKFRCKVGHHVEGQSTRKRILYHRCDLTGSWSGPKCTPVTCDSIDVGSYNCTSGNTAGSECKISCPNQESPPTMHRCELDGNWNPSLRRCTSVTWCSVPPQENDNLKFHCDGSYLGALCEVTCEKPDETPMKPGVTHGKIHLRCNARGRWQPNPTELSCEKKCLHRYSGDGYCDAINNVPQCDFDGGDCCESTAMWHTVKRFPHDCEDQCSCLDPRAKENEKLFDQQAPRF